MLFCKYLRRYLLFFFAVAISNEGIAAVITGVVSPAEGSYTAGQDLRFTVNFSEAVMVEFDDEGNGPRLILDLKSGLSVAAYTAGSGNKALDFIARLTNKDFDFDGIDVLEIELGGAAITSLVSQDEADLTITGLPDMRRILVNHGSRLEVPIPQVYSVGDSMIFRLHWRRITSIQAASPPMLTIIVGDSYYALEGVSDNDGSLFFNHTVTADDLDAEGFIVDSFSLSPAQINGKVSSFEDASDNSSHALYLGTSSQNNVPVISGMPTEMVLEGESYSFTAELSDFEGDPLTVTVSNLPSWLSLDTATGSLSGTPAVGDAGIYAGIVMRVDDGQSHAELAEFTIEVIGDHDVDGIADLEDVDDDNDGLSDEFELTHGFNPLDPSDAAGDEDNDGLSNLDEQLLGSNPRLDDQAPLITQPAPVDIDATGLLTKVSRLIAPQAIDELDGEVAVTLVGSDSLDLVPGRYFLTWFALDGAGNRAEVSQQIDIHPLISLSKDQVLGEGIDGSIKIQLNGVAPAYPLTVQIEVSGIADNQDHDLVAGSVSFEQDELVKSISFQTFLDRVDEGAETLEVSLSGSGNFGIQNRQVTTIVEVNVAPSVGLTVSQNGFDVLIVEQGGGLVNFTAIVDDVNPGDEYTLEWLFSDGVFAELDTDLQPQLDPLDLAPGIYQLTVRATDSGSPAMSNEVRLNYQVVETYPVLTQQDSDGDGISDVEEGFEDDDQDGLPNYLDAVALPNVLNEASSDGLNFLLESDPGVKLVLGELAIAVGAGGAKITLDQLAADYRIPNDNFANVGGYFDFGVKELPVIGQSVNVVLPQRQAISANALYRKYNGVWSTFVENARNGVMSALGEPGNCPPPQSIAYRDGLNTGDWCVQLTIEDGGPNDADGLANGSIDDPGGVSNDEGSNADSTDNTGGAPSSAPSSERGSSGGSLDFVIMIILLTLVSLRLTRTLRANDYTR